MKQLIPQDAGQGIRLALLSGMRRTRTIRSDDRANDEEDRHKLARLKFNLAVVNQSLARLVTVLATDEDVSHVQHVKAQHNLW